MYVARGCGKYAEYDCQEGDRGTLCVAHRAAQVQPDPIRAATAAPAAR